MAESPSAATPSPPDALTPVENTPPPGSPAHSDKTTVQEIMGDAHYEPFPSSGAAFFSTDLGRRPHRKRSGPPEPVIVRSDKIIGVVMFANMWRNKYPMQYHCIFPLSRWTIYDLWDEVDIHLETKSFLEEVLQFITRDNVVRAKAYAIQWSKDRPERVQFASGDLTHLYDPNDHLAIVDKIFINGETKDYPRGFLWHVANMIKIGVLTVTQNGHLEDPSAHPPRVTSSEQAVNDNTADENVPISADEAVNADQNQSLQPGNVTRSAPPSTSTHKKVPVQLPESLHHSPPSLHESGTHALPIRPPSFGQPPAMRGGYYHDPFIHFPEGMRQQNTTVSPQMGVPQLNNPKTPYMRVRSNSYQQAMQPSGWPENNPPQMTSGQHYQQTSGSIHPAGQSPHLAPHMAMGQPMVIHHPSMSYYPPYTGVMPPGSTIPRCPMPHEGMPGIKFVPMASTLNPAYESSHRGSYRHNPMPMEDMANNMQYSNKAPFQHMDTRPGAKGRGGQAFSNRGLFDPYNGEKPGFADNAADAAVRKGTRNSFSNPINRGRKFSTSNRPAHGQWDSDRPDTNATPLGARYIPGRFPQSFRLGDDPKITGDLENGCSENWIGPKNKEVMDLWVGEMPSDIKEDELRQMFEQGAGVRVSRVTLKPGLHAFVNFLSTKDAKKALDTRGLSVRGKSVAIRVPNRYFKLYPPYLRDIPPHGAYVPPPAISRVDMERTSRAVSDDQQAAASETAVLTMQVQYSPQDARSDLQKPTQKEVPQTRADSSGSPETKKSKEHQSSPLMESMAPDEHPPKNDAGLSSDVLEDTPILDMSVTSSGISAIERTVDALDDIPEESMLNTTSQTQTDKLPKGNAQKFDLGENPTASRGHPEESPRDHEDVPPKDEDAAKASQLDSKVFKPVHDELSKHTMKDDLHHMSDNPAVEDTSGGFKTEDQGLSGDSVEHDCSRKETPSDDEQAQEVSFHSAPELQSDPQTMETNTQPVTPAVDESIAAPYSVQDAQEGEPEFGPALKVEAKEDKSPKTDENVVSTEEITKESAATTKKRGAEQTESLHPFAKPGKPRGKKDREQRKKERKRGEKAKAEKIKLGKATSSIESTASNVTSGKEPALSCSAAGSGALEASSEVATEASTESHYDGSEVSSDKELADVTGDAEHSQHSGGNIPVVLQETVKVTQKMESSPNSPVDVMANDSSMALMTNAEDTTLDTSLPTILAKQTGEKNEKHDQEKKAVSFRDRVAIPNLGLLRPRTSPVVKVESDVTRNPADREKENKSGSSTMNGAAQKVNREDLLSNASSSTLVPGSPQSTSHSPSSSRFFTPLQTPITTSMPQPEASKKKKKKNKKKRQPSKSTNISEERASEDAPKEVAFGAQISHIDGIIAGSAQQGTYYSHRNEWSGTQSKDSKDSEGNAEDRETEKNILLDFQSYLQERAIGAINA